MKRIPTLAIGMFFVGLSAPASADIPAGYKGLPFDPAVAGGPCVYPTLAKGPYPIPGRLLFPAYDMGGSGVGFNTTDHYTFGGNCFRKDGTVFPSLSITSSMKDPYSANGDVWYDTGDSTLDGTQYPNATTQDVYIGAVRPGDWVNITVNVMQTGTYQVGSTWATGNGNPGGEGGNGTMELQISVNGTMMLDWKDTFPNYGTTADFHHWKPYPDMGTITLQTGLQVIKMLSVDPHLNLDYVEFSLVGADGGVISSGSGSSSGGSAASGSSSSGAATGGSSAGSGSLATTGSAGGSGASSGAGTSASGNSPTSGAASSGGNVGGASGTASSGTVASTGAVTGGNPVGSGANSTGGMASGTGGNGSSGATTAAAPAGGSGGGSSKGCSAGATRANEPWAFGWLLGAVVVIFTRSRRPRSRP